MRNSRSIAVVVSLFKAETFPMTFNNLNEKILFQVAICHRIFLVVVLYRTNAGKQSLLSVKVENQSMQSETKTSRRIFVKWNEQKGVRVFAQQIQWTNEQVLFSISNVFMFCFHSEAKFALFLLSIHIPFNFKKTDLGIKFYSDPLKIWKTNRII